MCGVERESRLTFDSRFDSFSIFWRGLENRVRVKIMIGTNIPFHDVFETHQATAKKVKVRSHLRSSLVLHFQMVEKKITLHS